MGGRGTYAAGKSVDYTYETVGYIEGIKVLEKLNKGDSISLPEEAHNSNSYILLDHQGNFRMYREYDENHYLKYEIGYHPEKNIDSSRKPVLHVHEYKPDNFKDRKARSITDAEKEKYKKYFRGVL